MMKQKLLNNWQLKLATLIFAFIFWRIVGGIADPITTESYSNIPVTMLNEEIVTDQGKVYQIENAESTVSVIVKAETSVLNSISSSNIIATADFEEIELSELIPIRIEIEGYEGAYIEATASPVNLKVVIEDSTSKKFPIVSSTIGSVSDNHALGTLTSTPETVTISGPQSLVDSIVRVEAQVNITGLAEDSSLAATMICYDENNATIDQSLLTINLGDEDELYVNVQVLDTKSVDISLATSGYPAYGYQVVSVTTEPTSIVVSATQEVLDALDVIEIPGFALNVSGESGKVERVIDVSLYLPEDVQLYDANNNSIAVTVQIDKLGTKSIEIPVQSIAVNNNPSDLALSYDGITEVMVTLTGSENTIDNIEIADVQLSIDLSSYTTAGEYDVPVTVSIPDGYEVVDEITVPIILAEN